uniref:O-methyltransferase C-terminal domain-containing protein n=1 Tax=Oryctolagus cuniculus TaxID=9986 RepID=A0A5F9DQS3_RABIT
MCPAWPLPRPGVAFLLPLGPSLGERGLRGHRRCVPRRPWSPPAGCGCLISCERQRGPRRRPRRWPGRWPPPCPGPRGCWTPAWAWGCCRRWSEVRGPRGSRGEVGEGCGRLSAGLPAVRRGRLVPVPGRRPTVGGRLVPASPGADRPLPLCPPPGGCPPSQATATRSWRAPTSCPAAPCPSVTSSCARVTAPGISVRAQSWRCVNRGGAPPRPTPVQPGPALGTPRGSPASWPRPAQPSPALGTQGRLPAHGATVRRALSQDRAPLSGEALPCFPDSPHGPARLTARRVAAAFDLSRFSAACSLGGCTLALARELAREHPQLHVTELDLHAVGQPPGQEDTQRMRCGTGGALQDRLPEASLHLLCTGLLGECADAQRGAVLARVAAHCPPGGGLLLVETPARGRPRSLGEYQLLLQQHGFGDLQGAHAESGLAAVLCTRETRPGPQ